MESPGRKKPTNKPVSTYTMPQTKKITHGPSAGSRRKTSGFSQSGRKLAVGVRTTAEAIALCMFSQEITDQLGDNADEICASRRDVTKFSADSSAQFHLRSKQLQCIA